MSAAPTETASPSKFEKFRMNTRGVMPCLMVSLVWLVSVSILGTIVSVPVPLSVPLLLLPVLASFVLLKAPVWDAVRFGVLPLALTLILINIVYADFSAAVLTIGTAWTIHRMWYGLNDLGDKFRFSK